jgi:hypothetical protein
MPRIKGEPSLRDMPIFLLNEVITRAIALELSDKDKRYAVECQQELTMRQIRKQKRVDQLDEDLALCIEKANAANWVPLWVSLPCGFVLGLLMGLLYGGV